MKFSVLLPTRNRLDLLARAIETVRRQDYHDWEIIVSDNCSEEDVRGYVGSVSDARIRYFRTDRFVPVSDNWNNALDKSDGDYIIMLGDDDGLMRGYFSTLSELIQKYGRPDFLYTNAFLYAYPGVLPDAPEGFLRTYSNRSIFNAAPEPFWLKKATAIGLVDASLDFRVAFDYNMQFSLVSRQLIQTMRRYGAFYQSPYPDYYASNAMMLEASRILVVPHPMVIIGISPKSFGYFYFNRAERDGSAFLKNTPDEAVARQLKDVVLPGTDMNTSWLMSMETLASNFGLHVNYSRYRELQIRFIYASLFHGNEEIDSAYQALKLKLTVREAIRYRYFYRLLMLGPRRFHKPIGRRILRGAASHPSVYMPKVEGSFNTLLDVFERIDPNCYRAL